MKALELAENALRLQTQYTMEPNIGRMNAARQAKDEMNAELRRLVEVNAELLGALEEALNAESNYPYGGMSESEIAAIQRGRSAITKAKAQP